jgi:penicillin-binding protein 1A
LQAYDRRHGWRGPERHLDESTMADPEPIAEELERTRAVADLLPCRRDRPPTKIGPNCSSVVETIRQPGTRRRHLGPAVHLRRCHRRAPVSGQRGSGRRRLVRLRRFGEGWRLAQIPQAEAALVSMDAETGAIVALVGGLDFGRNQFNRVVQSRRQPGSAFKPFIYAAALDHGFTAASVVNDAPVVVDDPSMERAWRPTNFSRRFHGPTRLREAMIHSRNLVSVRLLMDMGWSTPAITSAISGSNAHSCPTVRPWPWDRHR